MGLDAVLDRRKRCYTIVGSCFGFVIVVTVKVKIRGIRK